MREFVRTELHFVGGYIQEGDDRKFKAHIDEYEEENRSITMRAGLVEKPIYRLKAPNATEYVRLDRNDAKAIIELEDLIMSYYDLGLLNTDCFCPSQLPNYIFECGYVTI